MWAQVSGFVLVIAATAAGYWAWQPYTSTALVRLPAKSHPERVAPGLEMKLRGKVVLEALAFECGAAEPGRVGVRTAGPHEVELAFSCSAREGARRGVQTLVQQVLELGVEGDVVVERPVAPVSVEIPGGAGTISPSLAGYLQVPSVSGGDPTEPVRGPAYVPDASTTVQVIRPASEPGRRWFRY